MRVRNLITLVICILMVTICGVASAEVLFEDDFSGDLSKWWQNPEQGPFGIEDGRLFLGSADSSAHGMISIYNFDDPESSIYEDFVLTFTVQIESALNDTWHALAVRLLAKDLWSMYWESTLWVMFGANGDVSVLSPGPVAGAEERLAVQPTDFDFTQPRNVKIVKAGKEVTIYVEDELIYTLTIVPPMNLNIKSADVDKNVLCIPPLKESGYIGFFGHAAKAYLDNVKVTTN